jgi:hypothetical protein
MKKVFLLLISSIFIISTSCSKKLSPQEEVTSFISKIGQDSLSLLSDSSLIVAKMNQWKTIFKNVKAESYTMSDGITSLKKINITLDNNQVLLLRFYFIGKSLLKINVFPLDDNKTLWDSIISSQEQKFKKIELNTWEMNKQFFTSKVIYNDGYSNHNWSMDAIPNDAPNYFEVSVNLEAAYTFYSEKINSFISNNGGTNKFVIDFRNGTIKVPEGKVWVIKKADNYAVNDMDLGVFDTTKTCECVLKGALEQTTFLIVNGECIRLGTLSPGYERSIFTEGTNICIPNSTVHNRDNGRNEYVFYNQVFIDEFEMKKINGIEELSTFVTSIGFNKDEFMYIKYLNYLSAIHKPDNLILK